ncbi:hypothetical protein CVT25_003186 [Psilocybe cyanescens]|uniref:Uncharacterized protein n=1 Tax=Psilocybe cyanescens TaxID=93625 RepID=A0A409XEY2_PSICY|nr:hypothetical protein CVT25_003186 [Psilocybe cyanescens]
MTTRQRTMMYYGPSLESYCTFNTGPEQTPARVSEAPSGWEGDVDSNVQ